MAMRILIPGGSGQVGTLLARAFAAEGHEVIVIGRLRGAGVAVGAAGKADATGTAGTPGDAPATPWTHLTWDAASLGPWADAFDGADVVVNLAGRSVDCRYSARNRALIKDSRVVTTRLVGEAIAAAKDPPAVWLQASTATIYAHRHDAPNDEATGLLGGDEPGAPDTWKFSIDVARSWEAALDAARVPHTRKVALRSAMIMSPDRGGVFDVLLGLVRRGLGGRSGDGRQFVSWIHDADFIEALRWILAHEDLDGAVNVASPGPLPNADFMRGLREAWGMPVGLPAARWMLEVGAFVLRTETELVLKSRRVVPGRLLEHGFGFRFPEWPAAAADLCARWRASREWQAA